LEQITTEEFKIYYVCYVEWGKCLRIAKGPEDIPFGEGELISEWFNELYPRMVEFCKNEFGTDIFGAVEKIEASKKSRAG
jgi:hypothetical protein